jgi:hypothetical protein
MTLLRMKKPGALQLDDVSPYGPSEPSKFARSPRAFGRRLPSFDPSYHNHELLETGHVHLVVGGGAGDRKAPGQHVGTSAVPGFSNHTGADHLAALLYVNWVPPAGAADRSDLPPARCAPDRDAR